MLSLTRKSLFIKGRAHVILLLLAVQLSFFLSLVPVLEQYKRYLSLLAYAQVPSNQVEFYADVFEKYVSSQEVISPGYSLDLDIPHIIELKFKSPEEKDKLKADTPEIPLTAYKDQERAFLFIEGAEAILGGLAVLSFLAFLGVLFSNRLPFIRVFTVVDQLGIPLSYLRRIFFREAFGLSLISALTGSLVVVLLTSLYGEVSFLSLFKGEQFVIFLMVPIGCIFVLSSVTYLASCFRSA